MLAFLSAAFAVTLQPTAANTEAAPAPATKRVCTVEQGADGRLDTRKVCREVVIKDEKPVCRIERATNSRLARRKVCIKPSDQRRIDRERASEIDSQPRAVTPQ
jgi:hypothetical protein